MGEEGLGAMGATGLEGRGVAAEAEGVGQGARGPSPGRGACQR